MQLTCYTSVPDTGQLLLQNLRGALLGEHPKPASQRVLYQQAESISKLLTAFENLGIGNFMKRASGRTHNPQSV